MKNRFRVLILKLTHKMWNREISRILCEAQSKTVISSKQLHLLTSWFDPTQKHKIYKRGTDRCR